MKELKKWAFIVTKPIQLIIVLAILNDKLINGKITILFCDSFNNAFEIENRFRIAFNEKIHTLRSKDRIQAIDIAAKNKFDYLFIDSDVGLQHYIALLKFKLRNISSIICVYEEGYGTYTLDSYKGSVKQILTYFGIASCFGECVFTKKIFLYDSNEYIQKFKFQVHKVETIRTSLWEIIQIQRSLLNKIFETNKLITKVINSNICRIYLTNYNVDVNFLRRFMQKEGDLFIKYHPHIKKAPKHEILELLDTSTPFELILMELLENYKKIIIYDYNSAVRRYISDPRIIFKSIE